MVESQPSKLLVAGSIPVSRSRFWFEGNGGELQEKYHTRDRYYCPN